MDRPTDSPPGQTAFEKRRGISRVETRPGYAQVHISELPEPHEQTRINALEAVAAAEVSLDFVKFTPGGLSFLIRDDAKPALERALAAEALKFTVQGDRHVVMVHAVNMRDEEGLIARIVLESIASGAAIGHISDMHDRVLMVVAAADADGLRERLESTLLGGQSED